MRAWIDNFRLIMRGVGVIHKLSPYNLLAKCVRSVSNAALPFVNLYMSAAIVNALVAKASLKELFVLVVLTLVASIFTSKDQSNISIFFIVKLRAG